MILKFVVVLFLLLSLQWNCKQDFITLEVERDGKRELIERKVFKESITNQDKNEIMELILKFLDAQHNMLDSYYMDNYESIEAKRKYLDSFISHDYTVEGGIYDTLVIESYKVGNILPPQSTEIQIEINFTTIMSFHLINLDYKIEEKVVREKITVTKDNGNWKIKNNINKFLITKKYLLSKIKNRTEKKELYIKFKEKWKL